MVSTGKPSTSVTTEARTIAISIAGQAGRHRRRAKIRAHEPTPMASAAQFSVGSAWPRAASLARNGPGSVPGKVKPPRSLSWLAKMVVAMPQVKPTVTGCGM